MATVPTYDSSKELSPTPINPKTAATLGGEVVDLSEGISSIGEQIQKVQNLTEKSNAIVALSTANDQVHNKYQTYPDLHDAYDKATEDLDKNVETAASLVHDPATREQFIQEASRMKDSKQTSINYMIQGRILQQGKVSVSQRTQAAQAEFNHATTPAQEEDVKKRYNNYVDELINSNGVNPEWAEAHRSIQNYHFGVGKLLNDIAISNDPKLLSTIQAKMDNGDYGSLRDVDYASAKSKIEKRSVILDNQLKKNMKNVQERNARDLDYMFRVNNPNIEQHAEELYYTGQINKKTFDNYTGGNKKASLVDPSTDGSTYVEALAYISDPKTGIEQARNFIMEKYNQGKISPEDRNKLYDLSIRPMGGEYKSVKDVIGLEQTKKDESQWFKHNLNSALSFIKGAFHIPNPEKVDDKSVEMAKRFVQKLTDNTAPEQFIGIANGVIKQQRLLDRPEISAYDEDDGQVEQDEDGNRAVTMPDGNVRPAEENSSVDNLDGGD